MSVIGISSSEGRAGEPEVRGGGGSLADLRLPLLVLTLVAFGFVFVRTLPRDRILYEQLSRPFRPNPAAQQAELLAELRAKDPPFGSLLPVPSLPADDRSDAQATLLVMIGQCSNCVLQKLRRIDGLLEKHPRLRVVAVSPSAAAALSSFRAAHRLQMQMVSDPGGKLKARYNAVWEPRAYLLSATGRLIWSQPEWQLDLQQIETEASRRGTR